MVRVKLVQAVESAGSGEGAVSAGSGEGAGSAGHCEDGLLLFYAGRLACFFFQALTAHAKYSCQAHGSVLWSRLRDQDWKLNNSPSILTLH